MALGSVASMDNALGEEPTSTSSLTEPKQFPAKSISSSEVASNLCGGEPRNESVQDGDYDQEGSVSSCTTGYASSMSTLTTHGMSFKFLLYI